MKQITVADQIRHSIESMAPEFEKALPPHIDVKRFVRIAQTAIIGNPAILNCDRRSIYQACIHAAQDGLLPDGREGAIVPFKDKAQWLPMIAGILKKIRNSGELISITAQIVKERDQFRYWVDSDGEHLNHEPLTFGDGGKVIGVYALAKTRDGGLYIDTMGVEDVEKVRAVSRAKNAMAWTQWWDEMAKKTVLRRLSKRLPVSTDNLDLIRRDDDDEVFGGDEAVTAGGTPTETPVKKQSRLAKAIAATNRAAGAPESTEQSEGVPTNNEAVGTSPAPQNQTVTQAVGTEPSITKLSADDLLPFEAGYKPPYTLEEGVEFTKIMEEHQLK